MSLICGGGDNTIVYHCFHSLVMTKIEWPTFTEAVFSIRQIIPPIHLYNNQQYFCGVSVLPSFPSRPQKIVGSDFSSDDSVNDTKNCSTNSSRKRSSKYLRRHERSRKRIRDAVTNNDKVVDTRL